MGQSEEQWSQETTVMKILTTTLSLPQRDLISLLLLSSSIYRTLVSIPSLWMVLDFHEMTNAGDRLIAALSLVCFNISSLLMAGLSHAPLLFECLYLAALETVSLFISILAVVTASAKNSWVNQSMKAYTSSLQNYCSIMVTRYHHVKQIILEFAQGVEDKHLGILKNKFSDSLQNLEHLNLNVCQKVSDNGIEAITAASPSLRKISIYWNVRVTDVGISHLVKNCKHIVDLNLSGCKGISDKGLQMVADNYRHLESLDITRCIKITDGGLQHVMVKCSGLKSLNLYALSSFTDEAYKKISLLAHLEFLDLCGAQNLSDEGLFCIAKCKNIRTLNLTWCVRVTDVGVIAIAEGCTSLEYLSLFGIVGVTDKCLEALSKSCSNTITTLDVNGCIGIKKRSREELLQLFPYVRCFKVHTGGVAIASYRNEADPSTTTPLPSAETPL
ncbi:F-box protein isoform X1 [Tanacetum coccineum]|uniref:F-box protein isoform X1 n=1 Tax=Tanacetum coccineum TaxID=301880 RepID=A0ABQ5DYD4_9ASTR